MTAAPDLYDFAALAPPPERSPAEWASENIRVVAGIRQGAKWEPFPYQRGILEAFDEPGVEVVVWRSSSQTGKTSTILGMTGYYVVVEPSPILIVMDTKENAETLAVERLDPLIDTCPALAECVYEARGSGGGKASSTRLMRKFKGGVLRIVTAGAAGALASRSVRILVLDEVSRYKALSGEGDPIEVALARTKTFAARRRVMISSSPTIQGDAIDTWFLRGDQRRYRVPCVRCGYRWEWEWKHVKYDNDDPATARIRCPECQHDHSGPERAAALERGAWEPTAERIAANRHIVSFHSWCAFNPLERLSQAVADFLSAKAEAKRGSLLKLQSWRNTTLGLPWRGGPQEIDPDALFARRERPETWGTAPVPVGVGVLTWGVDVQNNRLEALLVGWGIGEEAWLIHHEIIEGDPKERRCWDALDELRGQTWRTNGGADLLPLAMMVDSRGHRTDQVYDYVRRKRSRRVMAGIGLDGFGRALIENAARGVIQKKKIRGKLGRPAHAWFIGVDVAKSQLISEGLTLRERGPRYIHLPALDWCSPAFCLQLTAEEETQERDKRGYMVRVFRQTKERNEAIDCLVYALAAFRTLGMRAHQLAEAVERNGARKPKPAPRPRQPRREPLRSGTLGRIDLRRR